MDGSEGPRADNRHGLFAPHQIAGQAAARPIVFWDERLSTAAVTRELISQNASRARRAEVIDRMATPIFLQGALDRLAVLTRSERRRGLIRG